MHATPRQTRTRRAPTAQGVGWRISASPVSQAGGGAGGLVIGDRAISLDQIQATQPMNVRERDADGALANCAIYLAVALLFFCGVMMFEWPASFLIGSVLFTTVALMAFADVVTSRPMTYATLTISLKDGETIDYVSAQACDRDALLEAIEHACPAAAFTRTHARQDSMPLGLPRLGGFLNVMRS